MLRRDSHGGNSLMFLPSNKSTNCESVVCGSREHRTDHTALMNYRPEQLDKLPVLLLKQGYHRGLFENSLEDRAREQVSGLLLVYSSHVCHVVESCSSTIHLIIQDLASLQSQGHGLFPDWYVAVAPSPVTSPQRTAEPQPTAELVAELLALLLTLAAGVQSSEDDSEDTLESVHTLAPELLIPAETINSLYNAEECASPEDFLSIYLSPSQPALDSETVWPVPSHPTP
nr:uncharacterized protein C7orf62 homolog isoform X3 [Columba livia]